MNELRRDGAGSVACAAVSSESHFEVHIVFQILLFLVQFVSLHHSNLDAFVTIYNIPQRMGETIAFSIIQYYQGVLRYRLFIIIIAD